MRTLLLLVLAACSTDPSGTWTVTSAAYTGDDCGLGDELLPSGEIALGLGGDELEIDFDDGFGDVECAWERSGAFSCPEQAYRTETMQMAQVTTYSEIAGAIRGNTLNGDRFGSMTCEGPDCADLEALTGITFPCDYDIDFEASR